MVQQAMCQMIRWISARIRMLAVWQARDSDASVAVVSGYLLGEARSRAAARIFSRTKRPLGVISSSPQIA